MPVVVSMRVTLSLVFICPRRGVIITTVDHQITCFLLFRRGQSIVLLESHGTRCLKRTTRVVPLLLLVIRNDCAKLRIRRLELLIRENKIKRIIIRASTTNNSIYCGEDFHHKIFRICLRPLVLFY